VCVCRCMCVWVCVCVCVCVGVWGCVCVCVYVCMWEGEKKVSRLHTPFKTGKKAHKGTQHRRTLHRFSQSTGTQSRTFIPARTTAMPNVITFVGIGGHSNIMARRGTGRRPNASCSSCHFLRCVKEGGGGEGERAEGGST